MSHCYVVTAQPATAALGSMVCSFTAPNSRDLVLSKGNHLEIYNLSPGESAPGGLRQIMDATMYGKIVSMDKYRPPNAQRDYIFLLTERKNFCMLDYDPRTKKLISISSGNVKDRVGREIETGICGLVDSQHGIVAMLVYEGLMKVFPVDAASGEIREPYNLRLEEIRYLDLKFLQGYSRPTFAILFEDNRGGRHVKTYCIDMRERELVAGPWSQMHVERTSAFMIPVPCADASGAKGGSGSGSGVVLVGLSAVSHIGGGAALAAGEQQASVGVALSGGIGGGAACKAAPRIVSWGMVDPGGLRYLLGDLHGRLYVLVLHRQTVASTANAGVTSMSIDYLGTTSIACGISHIDRGVVYINSRFGDSQLIRLSAAPVTADSVGAPTHVEVLETLTNIGPIVDMVVVDNAGDKMGADGSVGETSAEGSMQSQTQIVTCSGAYKDGSIRVVKSGIGIHEQASLEIPGIKGMWGLVGHSAEMQASAASLDKYLVQAFIGETRVLGMVEDSMEEVEVDGFAADETTLFCGNMGGGEMWVQATPSAVRLVSSKTLKLLHQLSTTELVPGGGERIALATGNQQQVVVATTGAKLVYLELNGTTLQCVGAASLDADIACLSIRPIPNPVGVGDDTNGGEMDMEGTEPDSSSRSVAPGTGSSSGNCISSQSNADTGDSSNTDGHSAAALISPAGRSSVLCVGLWTDNSSVRLYGLPSLAEITRVTLNQSAEHSSSATGSTAAGSHAGSAGVGTSSQVRDVLMISLDPSLLVLLAGMGDGSLITFTVNYSGEADTKLTLGSRRCVALGSRPISLAPFCSGGRLCVLAACDRPTVLYQTNGKLLFSVANISGTSSSTTADKVTGATSFNTEMFPEALALSCGGGSAQDSDSSGGGLSICTVGEIKKIHVQTHPLNASPRRICYCSQHQIYVVLTQHSYITAAGNEVSEDRIVFMRESVGGAGGGSGSLMTQVHSYTLDPMETGMSVMCSSFESGTGGDDDEGSMKETGTIRSSKQYVVVGTAQSIAGEVEPSRGRFLVFDMSQGQLNGGAMSAGDSSPVSVSETVAVSCIYEKEVKGAVFSLAPLAGRMVAGIGSRIQVLRLIVQHQRPELQLECSHYGHILTLLIKTKGDLVLVGDLLRSITVLRYTPVSEAARAAGSVNGTLVEVARDFNVNAMRAVEFFHDSGHYLGAEDFGNLFVTKRQGEVNSAAGGAAAPPAAISSEERGRLLVSAEYHVGDSINALRCGSLNAQPKELGRKMQLQGASVGGVASATSVTASSSAASTGDDDDAHWHSIMYGTVGGAIGVVLAIPESLYCFYAALELAIRTVKQGAGGFSHHEYRCLYNGRRNGTHNNSIDGDLVESFLLLPTDDMARVVKMLNDTLRVQRNSVKKRKDHAAAAAGSNSAAMQSSILSGDVWATGAASTSQDDDGGEFSIEHVINNIEEMIRMH